MEQTLQQVFTFNGQYEIRVVVKNGEPWFVAKDICDALDIANSRDAVTRLDDDEKGVDLIDTLGGPQNMQVVNEFGLYSLTLGSRKPEAKTFKRLVTHEILPSIRKTGSYSVNPASKWAAVREAIREKLAIGKELGMHEREAKIAAIKSVEKEFDVDMAEWKPKNSLTLEQCYDLLVHAGLYEYDENGKLQLTEMGQYYEQFRSKRSNLPWERFVWDRVFPGVPYLLREENAPLFLEFSNRVKL